MSDEAGQLLARWGLDQATLVVVKFGLKLGFTAAGILLAAGLWRDATYGELIMFELGGGGMIVLFGLLRGLYERRWRRREQSWTQVEATITKSEVKRAYPWGGGSDRFYAPDVRYRFMLDGVEHEGTYVQMDAGSNTSEADVTEWVARYPVGATLPALCDPKKPKHSVLELDDDGSGLITLAMGAAPAFVLFAIICALLDKFPPSMP
jgi:hypothetical protein